MRISSAQWRLASHHSANMAGRSSKQSYAVCTNCQKDGKYTWVYHRLIARDQQYSCQKCNCQWSPWDIKVAKEMAHAKKHQQEQGQQQRFRSVNLDASASRRPDPTPTPATAAATLRQKRELVTDVLTDLMSMGAISGDWIPPTFNEDAFREKPKPEVPVKPHDRSKAASRSLRLCLERHEGAKRNKHKAASYVDQCRSKLEKAEEALVERERELREASAAHDVATAEYESAQKAEEEAEKTARPAAKSEHASSKDRDADEAQSPSKRRRSGPGGDGVDNRSQAELGAWEVFKNWVTSEANDDGFEKFAMIHTESQTLISKLYDEYVAQLNATKDREADDGMGVDGPEAPGNASGSGAAEGARTKVPDVEGVETAAADDTAGG